MTSSPNTDSVSENSIAEIRADLEIAQTAARALVRESLFANTQRLYKSDWREFLAWVHRAQMSNSQLSALPANDETLALYIGAHVDTQPSTLARILAAIRLMHRWSGHESSFAQASSFSAVYNGYKRRWAQRRPSKPSQSAATESILPALVDNQPADSLIGLRNRALLLVGFDTALRRSEIVGLDVEHLSTHPEGIALYLPRTKADQDGQGSAAYLLARPESRYCPVRTLIEWIDAAQINEGAVFCRLDRSGTSSHLGVERLSDKAVYRLVKGTALALGVPGRFGSHSLLRGLIPSALKNKQAIGSIQEHARHKNLATISRYNQQTQGFKTHPRKSLLHQNIKLFTD